MQLHSDCLECYEAKYHFAQQLLLREDLYPTYNKKNEQTAMTIVQEVAQLRITLPPLRENNLSAKAEVVQYLATDPPGCIVSTDMLPRVSGAV